MEAIRFYAEDVPFQLANEPALSKWLKDIARAEGYTIDEINYIFCSDEYLLEINRTYLSHDYYTDIITFNNSDLPNKILSDIFISIDRVKENALDMSVTFEEELHRVMVHGLLHLMQYDDKTKEDQEAMRRKEDTCLSLLSK